MIYQIEAIGIVSNNRSEIEDDNWGDVVSTISLDQTKYLEDALKELHAFSHLEVIFRMDQVNPEKIHTGARHPRNQKDWPMVGVFAQRVKSRPNLLGVSRCELLDITGLELRVKGLDAINGTPVIDIKPYFKEFGPRGRVRQPVWATELMANYY